MIEEDNKVRDTIDAVTGLVSAVPIYQDIAQPAAQEIGKALQTVAKTVNVALAPISGLVWGYEQIKEFVTTKVVERLKNIPPNDIIAPKPNVAGPALEALRYTGHESSLSDLYANLLASAMDKSTANGAHPAFVEIIKQLTPDEAKIISLFNHAIPFPVISLRWDYKVDTEARKGGMDIVVNYSDIGVMAKCEYPDLTPTYIDNICRLGLAEIPSLFLYTNEKVYEALENSPLIIEKKSQIQANPELKATIQRRGLRVTELGKQFAKICTVKKT